MWKISIRLFMYVCDGHCTTVIFYVILNMYARNIELLMLARCVAFVLVYIYSKSDRPGPLTILGSLACSIFPICLAISVFPVPIQRRIHTETVCSLVHSTLKRHACSTLFRDEKTEEVQRVYLQGLIQKYSGTSEQGTLWGQRSCPL